MFNTPKVYLETHEVRIQEKESALWSAAFGVPSHAPFCSGWVLSAIAILHLCWWLEEVAAANEGELNEIASLTRGLCICYQIIPFLVTIFLSIPHLLYSKFFYSVIYPFIWCYSFFHLASQPPILMSILSSIHHPCTNPSDHSFIYNRALFPFPSSHSPTHCFVCLFIYSSSTLPINPLLEGLV